LKNQRSCDPADNVIQIVWIQILLNKLIFCFVFFDTSLHVRPRLFGPALIEDFVGQFDCCFCWYYIFSSMGVILYLTRSDFDSPFPSVMHTLRKMWWWYCIRGGGGCGDGGLPSIHTCLAVWPGHFSWISLSNTARAMCI
jgi:hypothetical protein